METNRYCRCPYLILGRFDKVTFIGSDLCARHAVGEYESGGATAVLFLGALFRSALALVALFSRRLFSPGGGNFKFVEILN